jgi:dTMP kinase
MVRSNAMSRGLFITFEGIEGSGKSVQTLRTRQYLESRGWVCDVTREPGGTPFGIEVRQVLLRSGGAPREPMSELLLYLADRYQHLKESIEPAVRAGRVVLSDRYHDATRAYQGAARGVPAGTIDALGAILGIREPDGTILLDLDAEVGLGRARARNVSAGAEGSEGRFEAEDLEFHRAVRRAYLELAERWPGRIQIVNATGTEDEVFGRIVPILAEWLRERGSK